MADLTPQERTQLRQFMAQKATADGTPIAWVKAAVNDTGDALANLFDGTTVLTAADFTPSRSLQSYSVELINTNSQPHGVTFTNPQKKWLGDFVFNLIYRAAN